MSSRIDNLTVDEGKVVMSVFSLRTPTRRAVASRSRFSIVKTSHLISSLEQRDVLTKKGKIRGKSGRPSHTYQLHADVEYTVGVVVGSDCLRICVMDAAKATVFCTRVDHTLSTDSAWHADQIVDNAVTALQSLREGQFAGAPIGAVGIALPGMVDSRNGVWLSGLQIAGISGMPIAQILRSRLGIPVFSEDIARSLAFLQIHRKDGARRRNFVLLYAGTGTGAGVVVNRRVYLGANGLAGEIGHVKHPDNRYRCSCNNVGCFETVLSVPGLLRLIRDRIAQGVRSSLDEAGLSGPHSHALQHLLAAAASGDRLVLMTLSEVAEFLGDSCATLIKLYDPECIFVSGPLVLFRPYLQDIVERTISRNVLPEMVRNYETKFARYRPEDEAVGAALVAMRRNLYQRTHPRTDQSREEHRA